MNRKSLGTDIYSPIRNSESFNDSSINTTDNSISQLIDNSIAGAERNNEKLVKRSNKEDTLELLNHGLLEVDKKNSSVSSSSKKYLSASSAAVEELDRVLPESASKKSSTTRESAERNNITRRRSPRLKEKADPEKAPKETSAEKRDPKNITLRTSRGHGEKKRSSSRSNVAILPTHSEASEDFKVVVPQALTNQDLSDKECCSGFSRLVSGVDSSCQTDLTLSDLEIAVENDRKYKEMKEVSVQNTQIQANIMEKLVKSIVGPEFDEVRQILYFHHLGNGKLLFKILEELESGPSRELLMENQQLRIENQQIRVENQQIRNENMQLRRIHFPNQYNTC